MDRHPPSPAHPPPAPAFCCCTCGVLSLRMRWVWRAKNVEMFEWLKAVKSRRACYGRARAFSRAERSSRVTNFGTHIIRPTAKTLYIRRELRFLGYKSGLSTSGSVSVRRWGAGGYRGGVGGVCWNGAEFMMIIVEMSATRSWWVQWDNCIPKWMSDGWWWANDNIYIESVWVLRVHLYRHIVLWSAASLW